MANFVPVSIISTTNNEAPPTSFKPDFYPVMQASSLRYANPFFLFTLRKILKKHNSTHLAIEHPYFGWLAILAKLFFGVKIIIRSQNIEALRFKSMGKPWWRLLWIYEKYCHRAANLNFFITSDDHEYALKHFKLNPNRCFTITYGFDFANPPAPNEKQAAKKQLLQQLQLPEDCTLLFFNGALDYKPNEEALDMIVSEINPRLLKLMQTPYRIIVCGKNLPSRFQQLENEKANHILYAGFVDDISLYFKGTDIFINPVIEGGGIKTKLVEALGNDLFSISTKKGATGVPEKITNNKLKIVEDGNWDAFADAVVRGFNPNEHIPAEFFSYFFWNNIAKEAHNAMLSENEL